MLPLLLSLLVGSINAIVPSATDPLLLVQVVIRHADRAGMHGYATNISEEVFFRGNGELSDAGIDNAYLQGLDYRKRYVESGFLDDRMLTNQIAIRSSAVPRVLMSAGSFTSALFSKTAGGRSKVAPIFTKDKEQDPLLVPPLGCLDGWDDVVEKYNLTSPKDAQKAKKKGGSSLGATRKHAQALIAILKKEMPEECMVVPPELMETIVAEHANPLITLPQEWVPCAENGAKRLMFKYMELLSGSGDDYNLQRLQRTAGLLTATLLDNMENILNSSSTDTAHPKFRVYYTHDINVLGLSYIFDSLYLFKDKTPAFSSSIVFELRNGTTGPYVNILLKNGQAGKFEESDRCQKDCTLDGLIELTKQFAIREPAKCVMSEDEVEPTTKSSMIGQSLLVLLITSLLSSLHL
ncbi:hypothetical protein PFISCL1PPCAC_6965 [Pristionchus fissidentatus]|uniref:acid phosphatase n=1 Tax=Pristionchus fissidentatus TaxID=1538716 RepID=A0AAV5VBR0_9BILA|nr:hypothetical protein PFISCL1PPCAC_6965 [Pristionchus fissidentatus]